MEPMLLIPTNINLDEWASLCTMKEDGITLSYLTYGFPVGYEGPVTTPSFTNHTSAVNHR